MGDMVGLSSIAPVGDAPPDGTAERILQIDNLAVAKGRPFWLLRDAHGRFALARELGGAYVLESGWVEPQAALDVALRVLGGDARVNTDGRALRGLAVMLVGIEAAILRKQMEGGR